MSSHIPFPFLLFTKLYSDSSSLLAISQFNKVLPKIKYPELNIILHKWSDQRRQNRGQTSHLFAVIFDFFFLPPTFWFFLDGAIPRQSYYIPLSMEELGIVFRLQYKYYIFLSLIPRLENGEINYWSFCTTSNWEGKKYINYK